jgi:hypothetical protein
MSTLSIASATLRRTAFACAIALTVLVFVAGFVPSTGSIFRGSSHWFAHLVSFAVLGFAWKRALPRASAVFVALGVIAFGFIHEAIEIAGHAHTYELRDAIVDSVGAAVGVIVAQLAARRSHADKGR